MKPNRYFLCYNPCAVDTFLGLTVYISSSLFGLFFVVSYSIVVAILGIIQTFFNSSVAIVNNAVFIASQESILIQNKLLPDLAHVAETMEESLGAPELAACQVGYKEYCPTGVSEDNVVCEIEFWECKIGSRM